MRAVLGQYCKDSSNDVDRSRHEILPGTLRMRWRRTENLLRRIDPLGLDQTSPVDDGDVCV
jgi:hypothetical protein